MWNFNLLAATRSIETAMPFVLYRLGVYFGTGLAYLFAALAGAGTFIAFASFSSKPSSVATIGVVVGLLGLSFLLYRFRGSLFFNVKAGQLGLLAIQTQNEKLPEGKAQIDLAKQLAADRFTPASFTQLSQLIGQVLSAMPVKYWPPLSKIGNALLAKVLSLAAGTLSRSCGQAMMATFFAKDEATTPYKLAPALLSFQASQLPVLLRYRLYCLIFEVLGFIAFFLLLMYPANYIAAALPVDIGNWRYLFAVIFAWSLSAAFLTPITTAAMAKLYFDHLGEIHSDSTITADLANSSAAFRAIRDQAV